MIAVLLLAAFLRPVPVLNPVLNPVENPEAPMEVADRLSAEARAIKGKSAEKTRARSAAIQTALDAYENALQVHRKDRKLAPRIHRRRASLFVREKRFTEALAEHNAILEGRARREDCARALLEGAAVLERLGQPSAAIARLTQVLDRYPDVSRMRARAALKKGVLLEAAGRVGLAQASYRLVVKKCRAQEKEAIAAFDALAVLALRSGNNKQAQRWIDACLRAYAKRAARGDKKGAFLGRELGAMKAPLMLVKSRRR